MDLYNLIANSTGWPPLVAFLVLIGGFGFWVLNSQINIFREKVDVLKVENENLKANSPDVLAQNLARRHKLLMEELERLNSDNEANQEAIKSRELEINRVNGEIEVLSERLEKIQILLSDSDLVCPHCGSPLATREYHSETVLYHGRDLDVDHEHISYECGLEFADHRVLAKCSNTNLPNDIPSA